MKHFLITCFLTFKLSLNKATYIIDNGIDVRLISYTEFCNIGRIEFYDGMNWGSFSDCSSQFNNDISSALCQTLGFDSAKSFNHGPYQKNDDIIKPKYTTYTNIYCPSQQYEDEQICDNNNDNVLDECDICVDCQLTNNFNEKCSENNMTIIDKIHLEYDIYVNCENNGNDPNSNLFNCTYYNYYDDANIYNSSEWHLEEFGSCKDSFNHNNNDKHDNVWKFFVVIGILILSVICMLIYCKTTKRMKHRRFTEAYMVNLENDNDIMLEPTSTIQTSPNFDRMKDFN